MVTEDKIEYSSDYELKNCCPECGETFFFNDQITGDIICSNCGIVLDSKSY